MYFFLKVIRLILQYKLIISIVFCPPPVSSLETIPQLVPLSELKANLKDLTKRSDSVQELVSFLQERVPAVSDLVVPAGPQKRDAYPSSTTCKCVQGCNGACNTGAPRSQSSTSQPANQPQKREATKTDKKPNIDEPPRVEEAELSQQQPAVDQKNSTKILSAPHGGCCPKPCCPPPCCPPPCCPPPCCPTTPKCCPPPPPPCCPTTPKCCPTLPPCCPTTPKCCPPPPPPCCP